MNSKNDFEQLAEIMDPTDENIKLCAEDLKNGKIVGIPTETVYGLGANALNTEAVKKIFEYKGRPLSDPLIVHVTSVDMARNLTNIDEETTKLFNLLAEKFWPGPLTIVLKANFDVISPILTASTEFIGIRYPNHKLAQKIIDYSGVPIAAPSANKFCHISPVNPYHVFEDFKEFPVKIINGGVCNFRMESTVIKILSNEKLIQILRMGAISQNDIKNFLLEKGLDFEVELFKKINHNHNFITKEIDFENKLKAEIELSQEAPGQFIKHYSPKLDTYIYGENETNNIFEINKNIKIDEIVFLDYKKILYNKFSHLVVDKQNFLDLSSTGSSEEVMLNLYDYLHKCENFENSKIIVICDIDLHMENNPHKVTLVDRVVKAAAERKINLKF